MKYELTGRFPHDIIYETEGPFVSLYQSTHRHGPLNEKDPIVFKNLVQQVENALKPQYDKNTVNGLMTPLNQIKDTKDFWMNARDGMAVLASPRRCVVYRLPVPVRELAIAAGSLHIKPLLGFFQAMEDYHLLGLSRDRFAVFKGNRFGFEEIPLGPEIPRTLTEVLGSDTGGPHLTHGSYAGTGSPAIYHGYGDKQEELEKDIDRFFRYVDRFVLDNCSRPEGLPLILVSPARNHGIFKKLSRNKNLMENGIRDSYEALSAEQLTAKAREIIEPHFWERMANLVQDFDRARSAQTGSDKLEDVARAAFENRVSAIMIEADRLVPGRVDSLTGELLVSGPDSGEQSDILDDLARMVFKNKGRVVVLPGDRMPSSTGAAAIYRY